MALSNKLFPTVERTSSQHKPYYVTCTFIIFMIHPQNLNRPKFRNATLALAASCLIKLSHTFCSYSIVRCFASSILLKRKPPATPAAAAGCRGSPPPRGLLAGFGAGAPRPRSCQIILPFKFTSLPISFTRGKNEPRDQQEEESLRQQHKTQPIDPINSREFERPISLRFQLKMMGAWWP